MNIKGVLTAFACCIAFVVPVSASASGNYGKACLIGEIGSESNWTVADDSISIDGDAKYEYTWNAKGDINYLALCITPAGQYSDFNIINFPKLSVEVNELWIDGKKVDDYEMGSNSADFNYFSDGSAVTRIYLKNGNTSADINDLAGNESIEKSVRVVFTVSGLGEKGTSNFSEVTETTTKAEKETTEVIKTTTTTTYITTATSSSSVSSTAVPDIDKSAPTGDKGAGTAIVFIATASATALAVSKFKKKKGE